MDFFPPIILVLVDQQYLWPVYNILGKARDQSMMHALLLNYLTFRCRYGRLTFGNIHDACTTALAMFPVL